MVLKTGGSRFRRRHVFTHGSICSIAIVVRVHAQSKPQTGGRAKVREHESERLLDFRLRLHISCIRQHQNTGDTSANCRSFEPLRFSDFRTITAGTLPRRIEAKHTVRGQGILELEEFCATLKIIFEMQYTCTFVLFRLCI